MNRLSNFNLWLRHGSGITVAPLPKGYNAEVTKTLDAMAADPLWAAWWSTSGFEYLYLLRAYYLDNKQDILPTSERVLRRGDHVEANVRVVFGKFDSQKWSLDESRHHARRHVLEYMATVAKRLKMAAPPLASDAQFRFFT